jgi:glucose-6-phosphate 1-dehydrogenase
MPEYESSHHAAPAAVYFIFGATGDLARRKLFPAFYSLYREGKLGNCFAVVGLARRGLSNEEFRSDVLNSILQFARYKPRDDQDWNAFAKHFHYEQLDIRDQEGFRKLKGRTEQLEQAFGIPGNRLFYLALAPEWFGTVSGCLKEAGLLETPGWHRLVIEKPFGYDYPSAHKLNEAISRVFREEEIFRIDHYLGKEMVQNIEIIRFANGFFEPLWNNRHIANVQITLAETVGVEERGAYYDKSGALRDMVQNHMLQMLSMIAMEPPSRLDPDNIRDEKVKVIRSIRRFESAEDVRRRIVRGQYTAGAINGEAVKGYRQEDKVAPDSHTETYFAARMYVDNFRWAGVPFYVRTGKRLPVKSTEVVVEFKNVPQNILFARRQNLEPNLLVIRVNPMEGIYIKINAKRPGTDLNIQPVAMDFCQSCQIGLNTPEAYERLLFDAARGDSTYFTRWDELAAAWQLIDPIAAAWKEEGMEAVPYPAGSWGPPQAHQLLAEDGYCWWPVNGQEEDRVVWETSAAT